MDALPSFARASVTETHSSTVLFLGDRAYKIKKPVQFPFLDCSEREARRRLCLWEVQLNRRLAPDVYLGVLDVVDEQGRPCEHMVAMRRLPDHRRLSTLVRRGVDVRADLRAVARQVARFHAVAHTSREIDRAGEPETLLGLWGRSAGEMERFAGTVLDAEEIVRIASLAERYVEGRRPLLARRIAGGKIRDGHGDLLADDIFCLPDGPRILDCLEFDARLRYGDVLADIAFLVMDLERLGRPDLGKLFLHNYREFSGDSWPESLVHLYVAYRAQVRSKVACLRYEQGDGEAAGEARRLLQMSQRHLEHGRVSLVLVGGPPGTGKSTLATALGNELGWPVLRTDEVRRDVLGVAREERAPAAYEQGLYTRTATVATYAEVVERAHRLLSMGESVIVDGSWSQARWRATAAAAAEEAWSDLVELRCTAPAPIAHARIVRRLAKGADISDASPAIAERMAGAEDPWPSAVFVDTSGDVTVALEAARAALAGTRSAVGAQPGADQRAG